MAPEGEREIEGEGKRGREGREGERRRGGAGGGPERVRDRESDRDKESNRKSLPGFLMTVWFLFSVHGEACQHFQSFGSKMQLHVLLIKCPFWLKSI